MISRWALSPPDPGELRAMEVTLQQEIEFSMVTWRLSELFSRSTTTEIHVDPEVLDVRVPKSYCSLSSKTPCVCGSETHLRQDRDYCCNGIHIEVRDNGPGLTWIVYNARNGKDGRGKHPGTFDRLYGSAAHSN